MNDTRKIQNIIYVWRKYKQYVIIFLVVMLFIIMFYFLSSNNVSRKNIRFYEKKAELIYSLQRPILLYENNKYAYINDKGKYVIKNKYNYAQPFVGEYAIVQNENEEKYDIINKRGKVVSSIFKISDIDFHLEYDFIIVNKKMYNSQFKLISPNNEEIVYLNDGFVSFYNRDRNIMGIKNNECNSIYETEFSEKNDLEIQIPRNHYKLSNDYAIITNNVNGKSGILNLKNNKWIFPMESKLITTNNNNIFSIFDKNYRLDQMVYIENDDVLYSCSDQCQMGFYNVSDKILRTYNQKDYKYEYTNLYNNRKQKVDILHFLDDDSIYFVDDYRKFNRQNKIGISKDDDIYLTNEYRNIIFLDPFLYEFIKIKTGKELIIAYKEDKTFIIDLKSKKIEYVFNTINLSIDEKSPFIVCDDEDNKIVYNLVTGKERKFKKGTNVITYNNFIMVREKNTDIYYNSKLKKIKEIK